MKDMQRYPATTLYETSPMHTEEQTQEYLAAIQAGQEAKEKLQQGREVAEEAATLRRAVRYGERCREDLIIAYLPLVKKIAWKHKGYQFSMQDLIQEGTLGLLNAVKSYQPEQNKKFALVATVKVNQAIHELLIEQQRPISLPRRKTMALNKILRVSKYLVQDLYHEPNPHEIAEEMSIPTDIVRKLLVYTQQVVSLDKPLGEEATDTIEDLIAADVPSPEEVIEEQNLRERMIELLDTLEPMEESVLKLRFGFMDEPLSPEETAEELGMKLFQEQRVEVKALRKMRHPSRSQYLKDFLYE